MARRRKVAAPEEDFPMTPMIDMVFLLLVFFMTVSTLAQAEKSIEVDLPESVESDVPKDLADRGTISIDAEGNIYLGMSEHDIASMKTIIESSIEENPELRIHVRADQRTPYESIRRVLRACAEVGAYEVIYATHQKQ